MLLQPVVEEEMILLPGHPVIHQIFVHLAVDPTAVIEVEREEAARVHLLRRPDRSGAVGVKIFRGFALDEDRVGPPLQDLHHRQHVALDDILERGDKCSVRSHLLVPPAIFGGEDRADEHLVHRRVELDPGIAIGKGGRVGCQLRCEVRILEVAEPIRHTEVAQVHDRSDVTSLQVPQGQVSELPIIFAGRQERPVNGRAVAKELDADVLDEVEVLAPALIMAARFHLIDPSAPVIDRRDAILDPGGEHEISDCVPPFLAVVVSACQHRRAYRRTADASRFNPGRPH